MSIMYLTYAIVYSNLHFDVSLEITALHAFLPNSIWLFYVIFILTLFILSKTTNNRNVALEERYIFTSGYQVFLPL